MKFREYIDKVNKKSRKSGPIRKIGIKTILGNPKLNIPLSGNEKEDNKKRYKSKKGKFEIPKHVKKIQNNNTLL